MASCGNTATKRLQLAQLLGQRGVCLTLYPSFGPSASPPAASPAAPPSVPGRRSTKVASLSVVPFLAATFARHCPRRDTAVFGR
jgi:hypothetical protein